MSDPQIPPPMASASFMKRDTYVNPLRGEAVSQLLLLLLLLTGLLRGIFFR